MKNPEISIMKRGPNRLRGKFFIVREPEEGTEEKHLYLHSDGIWREEATHEGEDSGYYNSQKEAEDFLAKHPC